MLPRKSPSFTPGLKRKINIQAVPKNYLTSGDNKKQKITEEKEEEKDGEVDLEHTDNEEEQEEGEDEEVEDEEIEDEEGEDDDEDSDEEMDDFNMDGKEKVELKKVLNEYILLQKVAFLHKNSQPMNAHEIPIEYITLKPKIIQKKLSIITEKILPYFRTRGTGFVYTFKSIIPDSTLKYKVQSQKKIEHDQCFNKINNFLTQLFSKKKHHFDSNQISLQLACIICEDLEFTPGNYLDSKEK
jgi:hypothetical protein